MPRKQPVVYLDISRPASEAPVIQTAEQILLAECERLRALVARAAKIIDDVTGEVLHTPDWHGVAWQWQKDAGVLPLGQRTERQGKKLTPELISAFWATKGPAQALELLRAAPPCASCWREAQFSWERDDGYQIVALVERISKYQEEGEWRWTVTPDLERGGWKDWQVAADLNKAKVAADAALVAAGWLLDGGAVAAGWLLDGGATDE